MHAVFTKFSESNETILAILCSAKLAHTDITPTEYCFAMKITLCSINGIKTGPRVRILSSEKSCT